MSVEPRSCTSRGVTQLIESAWQAGKFLVFEVKRQLSHLEQHRLDHLVDRIAFEGRVRLPPQQGATLAKNRNAVEHWRRVPQSWAELRFETHREVAWSVSLL